MFVRYDISALSSSSLDRLPASKSIHKRAPLSDEEKSDDDDDKFCHPFVIMDEVPLLFGCPTIFTSGKIVWSNKMTGRRASDVSIRNKLTEFIALHHAGATLKVRQDKIREMWAMQYNQEACVFLAYFMCALALADVDPRDMLKRDAIDYLIDENTPFIPWDIFQDFVQRLSVAYIGVNALPTPPPSVNWRPVYEAFNLKFPFNGENVEKPVSAKVGNSIRSEKSQSALKTSLASWQSALDDAKLSGLSQMEKDMLLGDEAPIDEQQSSSEALLRDQLLAKRDAAMVAKAKETVAKALAKAALLKQDSKFGADPSHDASKNKRPREEANSDDDEHDQRPQSGTLAFDKFMRAMRLTIERSDYINFASMSKDRLDQLHVLGVGSANSKRLSSSTVLVTSASEADVKVATYDYEAISSGFLYTYITLLSESSFVNATTRVKDRLAWWQWLTSFFADNKPAAVKFIHWFMLDHHSEELWLPVTKTQCVLLAIKAKEECPLHSPSISSRSGPPLQSKSSKSSGRAAKVRPGPGTLTVNGGTTFTPSQTAKLVQWRSRFPGSCASRMTNNYTCSKEKRGLPCKFKHVCVWCSSASCKAACTQAEKL